MSARRRSVAPLLAELREQLLVSPSDAVIDEHLAIMMLEQQLLRPARVPQPDVLERARRAPSRRAAISARPRRTAVVMACVCATFATFGLNAAGALPSPLRHLTDTITRPFKVVPQPTTQLPVRSVPGSGRAGAAQVSTSRRVAAAAPGVVRFPAAIHPLAITGDPVVASGAPQPGSVDPPGAAGPAQPPTPVAGGRDGGGTGTPPVHKPPRKTNRKFPTSPPGFPTDWQARAVSAALSRLQACAQADTAAPSNCPQQIATAGASAAAQWTLLSDPLAGAVAVVAPRTGSATNNANASGTVVDVYGRFQMIASYNLTGSGPLPLHAYSGGVAEAVMTWNGSSFQGASFESGSVAVHVPAGVSLPSFQRAAAITDAAVLAAVGAGFSQCAAAAPAATGPADSNCPDVAGLVGDPTQGAAVAFDADHGDFTVSGSYAVASTDPQATGVVTRQYTATLCVDGGNLLLVSITGAAPVDPGPAG